MEQTMKLVLKNDFSWDGLYWICDEAGLEKYYVDARVSDSGRCIYVLDASNKEIGAIRQKSLSLKKEYGISRGNEKLGNIIFIIHKEFVFIFKIIINS